MSSKEKFQPGDRVWIVQKYRWMGQEDADDRGLRVGDSGTIQYARPNGTGMRWQVQWDPMDYHHDMNGDSSVGIDEVCIDHYRPITEEEIQTAVESIRGSIVKEVTNG